MADTPATDKQLAFLKQLTGKDYAEFNLTSKEASRKIEELTGKEEGAKKPSGKGGYKADPIKTESIEHQVCLKCATELAVAGRINFYDILETAEIFYQYIKGDITIEFTKVYEYFLKKGVESETTKVLPVKETTPAIEAETDNEVEQERSSKVQEPVTTIPELLKWTISHGKEFHTTWICEALNISKVSEIKDVAQAQQDLKDKMNWA